MFKKFFFCRFKFCIFNCCSIIVLKIGNTDSYVDGISSASARNELQEVVTYK